MTIARLTLTCHHCKMSIRVERILNKKSTVIGAPQYCMWCAQPTLGVAQDTDLDWDEVLAESYDMSVERFKKVYALWLLVAPHKRFTDFVEEVKRAALAKQANT